MFYLLLLHSEFVTFADWVRSGEEVLRWRNRAMVKY